MQTTADNLNIKTPLTGSGGMTSPRQRYPIRDRVIAHRGVSGQAPENTEAAIRLAAEQGCRWVEVDVAISSDHIPVIFHDANLERCSNGHGLLALTPWQELQTLDAGSWFDARFQHEPLLSLESLLALASNLGISLNLEIKPVSGLEQATVAATVAVINQHKSLPDLLFSSFSSRSLQLLQQHLPEIPRALNVDAIPVDWKTRLQTIDACGLHFAREFFEPRLVAEINQHYGVSCFTVNDSEPANALWRSGVDAVFSDLPELLMPTSHRSSGMDTFKI